MTVVSAAAAVTHRLIHDAQVGESQLDQAFEGVLDIREMWILRPVLREAVAAFDRRSRLRRAVDRAVLDMPVRGPAAHFGVDNYSTVYCWSTVNQFRGLGGTSMRQRLRAVVPSVGRTDALSIASERGTRRLARSLADMVAPAGVPRRMAHRMTRLAVQAIRSVEHVVEQVRPARFVVASQHSLHARAVAWISREREIPTVYVPHAPLSTKRQYADLPFDYGALRGSRSIAYYESLGADCTRLRAIGDMSMPDLPEQPTSGPNLPLVVAPSPWGVDKLGQFFDFVRRGTNRTYDVYPHPRSDIRVLGDVIGASGRLVVGRRTADALVSGAAAVIQHGSGVALEAMLLGVPVIEILLDGSRPRSPATVEPHAYVVADAQDLRHALGAIAAGESAEHVQRRRAWAREWCATTGAESRRRLCGLLASRLTAEGPLVDGWHTDRARRTDGAAFTSDRRSRDVWPDRQ